MKGVFGMTKRKLLALFTAMTLGSTLIPTSTTPAKAATTLKFNNISKNKKTMYVGSTFTIKTNISKSKLTYKSSKTAIATVSKKGNIKAKKAGACVIKVTAKLSKSKKITKKIKLTVKKKVITKATASVKETALPLTVVTASPNVTTTPVATSKPTATVSVTNTPVVTKEPSTVTATPTATPKETVTPRLTNTPTTSAVPATTPTATPKVTSTPTVTTEPAVTGTVFISSIHFDEESITLEDADGNTVVPSDAANLSVDGTTVTIVAPTTDQEIAVSGNCSQGQIRINVDKTAYPDGEVDLSFEGLTLSNTLTSPVYVASIDGSVNISVKKGTKNTLSDGEAYTNEDNDNGVIYSKDDLKIKGKGSLTITGNCGYGIISKDDLKVYNGTITVTSKDVCLKGKDSVKIGNKDDLEKDGAYDNLILNLTSTASDCVRSNNPIDDTSKASEDSDYADGKEGTIVINGGTITAHAYADAFQSNGTLTVNGGTLDLYTYEGSSYSNTNNPSNSWNGNMPGNWSNSNSKQTLDISAKGLKSEGDMTINGGTITADTSDDALHCGGKLIINNGNLELSTGDDGIHSDTSLEVNGGIIHINKCYEGLEGTDITINDGTIHVISSDDGINAAGGNSNSTWNGFPGFGNNSSNTNYSMTINGGYILVEASGDGLDSNGSLTITGGTTLVIGPTSGADNAFDCDGTFSCTGGIALGIDTYNQMSRFPSNTTNYLTRSISGANSSGSNAIAITDADGNVLSYLTYSTSAGSLTYYNGNATASDLKVYLNPDFTGNTDDFGYASSGTVSGGTELTTSSNSGSNTNQPGGNNRPGR